MKRLLSSMLLIGSVSLVGCKSQKQAAPAEPRHEAVQPQPYIPAPTETAPAAEGSDRPMAAEEGHGMKYTVKKGDTLSKIARHHHTTVKKIVAANPGIEPNHIRIGQVINIP